MFPEDILDAKLAEAEETYKDTPFDLYNGVDRSVYKGTFALTTAAYRENAYSELNKLDDYFNFSGLKVGLVESGFLGFLGGLIFASGCMFRYEEVVNYPDKIPWLERTYQRTLDAKISGIANANGPTGLSNADWIERVYNLNYGAGAGGKEMTFLEKLTVLQADKQLDTTVAAKVNSISTQVMKANSSVTPVSTTASVGPATAGFLLAGGAMMIYSAVNLGISIYNYYNPKYADIPVSLVDLVETVDGDRYIKYDVVYEAEPREENEYCPADLNAFEAKAWNALYFTKSYEAGKPLLADEFSLSNTNNKPKSNFLAVHGFGENICYNLNRYNFDEDVSIYLSVKQSKNQKSAVADVPEVIGSMFGAGFLFLAGGIGVILGVGGTLVTNGIVKKSRAKSKIQEES
jgi:hypothetical protein